MQNYTVFYALEDCSRRTYDGAEPGYLYVRAETPGRAAQKVARWYEDDEDNLCVIVGVVKGWGKVVMCGWEVVP